MACRLGAAGVIACDISPLALALLRHGAEKARANPDPNPYPNPYPNPNPNPNSNRNPNGSPNPNAEPYPQLCPYRGDEPGAGQEAQELLALVLQRPAPRAGRLGQRELGGDVTVEPHRGA